MLQNIHNYMGDMLPSGVNATQIPFKVLTGCRPKKFSFHVVAKYLFCESSVLTIPLLVFFEIARRFTVDNTNWLFTNPSQERLGTIEGQFRLRALMLFKSLDMEPDGSWFFKGFNDTPFDEAVYTSSHLIRAPGAAKAANTDVAALHPWTDEAPCLVESRRCQECFTGDNHGLVNWRDHLIGGPFNDHVETRTFGIEGWKQGVEVTSEKFSKFCNF